MTTAVRKRQMLTGMKYDRVDLVPDGANAFADILIAKNRQPRPRVLVVAKAMGTVECNNCGMNNGKNAQTCRKCGSTDLAKTKVEITKTTVNPKKQPKNDDAENSTSNADGFTFEDEQYDQDNGENGTVVGDTVERPVNKNSGWFPIRKDDVDDVDNERNEHQKEGEDPDDDIEEMAMKKPTGLRPDRRSGFINTATGSHDSTMLGKARKLRKEKPGLNSWDYGDQGSQEVAESAEQMYRAESQPTKQAQDRRESTMSDVFAKARRKRSNKEGLDIIDHGNSGIYERPGVKRNGTNTGHNKTTNAGRTAVAPPKNPLDVGKSLRVPAKVSKAATQLPALEALSLGLGFAENIYNICKNNRPDLIQAALEDLGDHLNAAADTWFSGSTVTKASSSKALAEDSYVRARDLIGKASPEAEMSDEASEGEDPNEVDKKRPKNTSNSMQNAGGDETGVGKSKVNKSLGEKDPYAGLSPIVKKKLDQFDELMELRSQEKYLAKARELRGLPGFDEEKVAKSLRFAYEEQGQEEGDYLFRTLSASAAAVGDSAVFKQFGVSGVGTVASDDPMAKADEWAQSQVSKAKDGTTVEQLRVQYMREHPAEFYQPAKQVA